MGYQPNQRSKRQMEYEWINCDNVLKQAAE